MSEWFAGKRKRQKGRKEDRQDYSQVPLTDPCGWTEQDLSNERSACYCWCSRQGDFCPKCSLDYQTVTLHLNWDFVLYVVSMGKMCQNSAAMLMLMGNVQVQMTHVVRGNRWKQRSVEIRECAFLLKKNKTKHVKVEQEASGKGTMKES